METLFARFAESANFGFLVTEGVAASGAKRDQE